MIVTYFVWSWCSISHNAYDRETTLDDGHQCTWDGTWQDRRQTRTCQVHLKSLMWNWINYCGNYYFHFFLFFAITQCTETLDISRKQLGIMFRYDEPDQVSLQIVTDPIECEWAECNVSICVQWCTPRRAVRIHSKIHFTNASFIHAFFGI